MTKKTQKNKTLANLEHGECKWPIGDPRHPDFHFCGAQQVLGRPYCIEHWQMSFIPAQARSRHGATQPAAQPVQPALPARKAA